jgi:hypothetical protein
VRYKAIPGKSCSYGDFEATAISEGVVEVRVMDTSPFTFTVAQVCQLRDVMDAVIEWDGDHDH